MQSFPDHIGVGTQRDVFTRLHQLHFARETDPECKSAEWYNHLWETSTRNPDGPASAELRDEALELACCNSASRGKVINEVHSRLAEGKVHIHLEYERSVAHDDEDFDRWNSRWSRWGHLLSKIPDDPFRALWEAGHWKDTLRSENDSLRQAEEPETVLRNPSSEDPDDNQKLVNMFPDDITEGSDYEVLLRLRQLWCARDTDPKGKSDVLGNSVNQSLSTVGKDGEASSMAAADSANMRNETLKMALLNPASRAKVTDLTDTLLAEVDSKIREGLAIRNQRNPSTAKRWEVSKVRKRGELAEGITQNPYTACLGLRTFINTFTEEVPGSPQNSAARGDPST